MKFSGNNLLSAFLLIALTWMWNCDLRASVGFFCPDQSGVYKSNTESPTSSHNDETQLPDCHKTTAEKGKSSNHSECSHCMELEWETANHYFPNSDQFMETISWIVWNEIFSLSVNTREANNSLVHIAIFSKYFTLDSLPSTLETNLRLRI
jgi:hypothetical protein